MNIQQEINSVFEISNKLELVDLQDTLQSIFDFYVENSFYFAHVPVLIFVKSRIEDAVEYKDSGEILSRLVAQSVKYLEKLQGDCNVFKKRIENEENRKKRIAELKKAALLKDKAKDKHYILRG
jgi:hypothetical protein